MLRIVMSARPASDAVLPIVAVGLAELLDRLLATDGEQRTVLGPHPVDAYD